jgi:hypothetical protein
MHGKRPNRAQPFNPSQRYLKFSEKGRCCSIKHENHRRLTLAVLKISNIFG